MSIQRTGLRTIVYVDDESDIREMVQLSLELTDGAAAIVAKPFDPKQLGNQVLAIWEALPP